MISADALAGPGLLALLIAIPICCVLAALGRKGVVLALTLLVLLSVANFSIATKIGGGGYGDSAFFLIALPLVALIGIGVGASVGAVLRTFLRIWLGAKARGTSTSVS